MEDIAIHVLQGQVRNVQKQIAQVKNTMKNPPQFDDFSLHNTLYLRWVQTLES